MTEPGLRTIGETISRCKPNTTIDVFFRELDGVDRVPPELGYRPTVADILANQWLCAQPVARREHFNGVGITSGWTLYVPAPFDERAYRDGGAE